MKNTTQEFASEVVMNAFVDVLAGRVAERHPVVTSEQRYFPCRTKFNVPNTIEGNAFLLELKEAFSLNNFSCRISKRGRNANRKQFYGLYRKNCKKSNAQQDLRVAHATHFVVYLIPNKSQVNS